MLYVIFFYVSTPESILWFIEDQAFLPPNDLAPPPPPPSLL